MNSFGDIYQLLASPILLLFIVDGKSVGQAMYEMQLKFGSTWNGFVPAIDNPSDTPLETAMKRIIRDMIQPHPAHRIKITEVVDRLAELQVQYGDVSPTRSDTRAATVSPTMPGNQMR